ncbi:hypothetical protein HRG_013851 [Hirsutella rhossiliensis]
MPLASPFHGDACSSGTDWEGVLGGDRKLSERALLASSALNSTKKVTVITKLNRREERGSSTFMTWVSRNCLKSTLVRSLLVIDCYVINQLQATKSSYLIDGHTRHIDSINLIEEFSMLPSPSDRTDQVVPSDELPPSRLEKNCTPRGSELAALALVPMPTNEPLIVCCWILALEEFWVEVDLAGTYGDERKRGYVKNVSGPLTTFTECILMMREDPSPHSSLVMSTNWYSCDELGRQREGQTGPLAPGSDNDGIDQSRDPGNGRHDVIARIDQTPRLVCHLSSRVPHDLPISKRCQLRKALTPPTKLQLCIDPPVPPLLLPGHSFDDKNGVFLPFNPDRLSMRFARWKIRNANPRDTSAFDEATLQALREPQQEPARISLNEIRPSRRKTRRGQGVPQQEATALQPRNGKAIVPLEEIVGTLDDLERQRAEARARPRASDTEPVRRPNTPEMTLRPPQTPPSRKRRGERQEGLLTPVTPPPSGQGRPRKRPRLPHEAVQFQQRSVDAILQHRECIGRKILVQRSTLALQVETSKSFYEAFTDERTLPISHCIFCYRKFPPARLTILQWRECLTPWLVQATTALQKCEKCLPSDADPQVDICLECRAGFERGKLPTDLQIDKS